MDVNLTSPTEAMFVGRVDWKGVQNQTPTTAISKKMPRQLFRCLLWMCKGTRCFFW